MSKEHIYKPKYKPNDGICWATYQKLITIEVDDKGNETVTHESFDDKELCYQCGKPKIDH